MNGSMTPAEIVEWLDKHVIGQEKAKRSVAIALRNRYRRKKAPPDIRQEIYPSNLIMMGPTGVGKTEIAKRLASLTGAPFVKVEATKYTETGYVGRDVESMIRSLVQHAVNMEAEREKEVRSGKISKRVNEKLVAALRRAGYDSIPADELVRMVENGSLDEVRIEIQLPLEFPGLEIFPMVPGRGFDEQPMNSLKKVLDGMFGERRKKAAVTVEKAREKLVEDETRRILEGGDYVSRGLALAREEGILFIDEIDKIIGTGESKGPEVSRSGVQRDLLPIVEGCTVPTKYGPVKTDHILFIAAGAFHGSSPSDLIPELQGRFPMRVELDPLSEEDLFRVFTEPENSLLRQYTALLAADGVDLELTPEAARILTRTASHLNTETEDIGARRLRPVLTYLLDEQLFGAPDLVRGTVRITGTMAEKILLDLDSKREDGNYIL